MNTARGYNTWTVLSNAGIEETANMVNKNLTIYLLNHQIYNKWFILDYPDQQTIRTIYRSSNIHVPNEQITIDKWDIIGADMKYYLSHSPIGDEFFDIMVDYSMYEVRKYNKLIDIGAKIFDKIFGKRNLVVNNDINNTVICLQRNVKTDVVTLTSKCIKHSKSQWYIKTNGRHYHIILSYDNKCLYHKNNDLFVDKCNDKNINMDFILSSGLVCLRSDKTKCLSGKFDLIPVTYLVYNCLSTSFIDKT